MFAEALDRFYGPLLFAARGLLQNNSSVPGDGFQCLPAE